MEEKNSKKQKKILYSTENSVGKSYKSKINKVVSYLKNKGADFHFITASENNAWLLNIRGKDSDYSPIPDSYILIDKYKKVNFFCDLKKNIFIF